MQQSYCLVSVVQYQDLNHSSVLCSKTTTTTHKGDVQLCLSEALTDMLIDWFPNGQQEAV